MLAEIAKMEGVICPVPNGAFYAAAELPVDDAERSASPTSSRSPT